MATTDIVSSLTKRLALLSPITDYLNHLAPDFSGGMDFNLIGSFNDPLHYSWEANKVYATTDDIAGPVTITETTGNQDNTLLLNDPIIISIGDSADKPYCDITASDYIAVPIDDSMGAIDADLYATDILETLVMENITYSATDSTNDGGLISITENWLTNVIASGNDPPEVTLNEDFQVDVEISSSDEFTIGVTSEFLLRMNEPLIDIFDSPIGEDFEIYATGSSTETIAASINETFDILGDYQGYDENSLVIEETSEIAIFISDELPVNINDSASLTGFEYGTDISPIALVDNSFTTIITGEILPIDIDEVFNNFMNALVADTFGITALKEQSKHEALTVLNDDLGISIDELFNDLDTWRATKDQLYINENSIMLYEFNAKPDTTAVSLFEDASIRFSWELLDSISPAITESTLIAVRNIDCSAVGISEEAQVTSFIKSSDKTGININGTTLTNLDNSDILLTGTDENNRIATAFEDADTLNFTFDELAVIEVITADAQQITTVDSTNLEGKPLDADDLTIAAKENQLLTLVSFDELTITEQVATKLINSLLSDDKLLLAINTTYITSCEIETGERLKVTPRENITESTAELSIHEDIEITPDENFAISAEHPVLSDTFALGTIEISGEALVHYSYDDLIIDVTEFTVADKPPVDAKVSTLEATVALSTAFTTAKFIEAHCNVVMKASPLTAALSYSIINNEIKEI
jgi:hypothetical protein